jgi:hypothetical protein
VSFT